MRNPLIRDRDVDFLLYDVLDGLALTRLPYFAQHDRETFDLVLDSARRFARDVLYPAYKPMDEEPPRFEGGGVTVHPRMKAIYPRLVDLGLAIAPRPTEVGGQQLPMTVLTLATSYLMAANLERIQLRRPQRRRRAPAGGVRNRRAAGHVHGACLRRPLGRHDGADRASGGLEPCRRRDRGDPGRGRQLPHQRLEDLHVGRRPRPDREHRAHDAGPRRRGAGGCQGRLAVLCAEAARRGWTPGRQRRQCRGRDPQDRLARPSQPGPVLRRTGRLPRLAGR